MKKLSNSRLVLGFALVVVLANPALVARADGAKKNEKVEDVAGAVKWLGKKIGHGIGKGARFYIDSFKDGKKVDLTDDDKAAGEGDKAAEQAPPPPPAPEAKETIAPPPPPSRQPVYTWTTDTQYVNRAGRKNGARESAELRLSSTQHRQGYNYRPVDTQVPVYKCSESSPSGNDWNGFFTKPAAEKAAALAATIKGVGKPTAEKLIDLGTFRSKPRSWQQFVDRISAADDQIDGLYQNVIVKFGTENRASLGYGPAVAGTEDCTIERYRNQRTYVEEYYDEVVPGSTRFVTFDLFIEGGELLNSERETFTVTYSADKDVYVEAPNSFNHYRIESIDGSTRRDGFGQKLAIGSRNHVKPQANLQLFTKWVNGEVVIEVTDLNYDANARGLGDRTISWSVYQNYNLGDKVIRQGTLQMSGNWASYKTGVKKSDFAQGRLTISFSRVTESYSKAAIQYQNSNYFDTERSDEKQSDKIRIQ